MLVCTGAFRVFACTLGSSAAFLGVYVLARAFVCLWAGVWLFFCGRLVTRWVIMLLVWGAYVFVRVFVWVFARVFISVFSWVLGCVLDLLGLLPGGAAEIFGDAGERRVSEMVIDLYLTCEVFDCDIEKSQ